MIMQISPIGKKLAQKFPLVKQLGRKYFRYRRYLFEFLGSDRYSKPARFQMDKKLETYLPNNGFFIEVGANNGFSESNTYYLEQFKGWSGILIEPIPELYQECVRERPQSKVFNYALVSADYPAATIEMKYAGRMSSVKNFLNNSETETKRLATCYEKFGFNSYEIQVPAKTLTSILEELEIDKIDFFSLDVEGFELDVLKGLDLEKYRPEYILVESLNSKAREKVMLYLSNLYSFINQSSPVDYLYQRKSE